MTAAPAEVLDLNDLQGLVVRGYGALPEATFLLLRVRERRSAATALTGWAAQATSAESRAAGTAMHLAFTNTGLAALLGAEGLLGFSEQFVSGMATTYRSRLLGDQGPDDPMTWAWGGPGTPPVDMLVLLYARTTTQLSSLDQLVTAQALAGGLEVVARLATHTLGEREPFGFHDGISQPLLLGVPGGRTGPDGVATGEFVLGYKNEYGQRTERPLLDPSLDPERLLPRDVGGTGAADLGRNGSYLVVRQLAQDVDAFHSFLEEATRTADGNPEPAAAARLGAQLVGRWPSGAPLVFDPAADNPDRGDVNDFAYHGSDPDGLACPIGAHIRRANPRDALEPKPGTAASVAINHRHRILRRGRGYATVDADGVGQQGLYFMCLNANLARQFEFIQHSWLNDPGFNRLDDAPDPFVGVRNGHGSTFTVQARPLRRRYRDLPRFVNVRGGAYFFLPGVSALRYLAWRAERDKEARS